MDSGDIGEGDSARERKLVNVLRDYLTIPVPASYKVPDATRQNSIVPTSFLAVRTSQHAAFYSHSHGANWALRDTLRSMVASGYLLESQKDKVVEAYHYHGEAYRIVRLPDYATEKGNR